MSRHQYIKRLASRYPNPLRSSIISKYRAYVDELPIKNGLPKHIGLFGEVYSHILVPFCFNCESRNLNYSFLDHLENKEEKSWRDIECNRCGEFIVEVKSTTKQNPSILTGGSLNGYKKLPFGPYLLVHSEMMFNSQINEYMFGKSQWFIPYTYSVTPNRKKTSINIKRGPESYEKWLEIFEDK